MATIIDFSPTALEIDEVAQAAGTINTNVAPPVPYTSSPVVNPASTPSLANLFTSAGPDILFISEYAASGQQSSGVLVVWEDFYNATHYELFRRNLLSTDTSWQRILVCDVNHLATETNFFAPYINNTLQLTISSKYFAILDTDVPTDQIVEYKVTACYYPTSANIDYSVCLRSQNLVNSTPVAAGETLFDFSQRVLGTQDYAWVVALINDGVHYFGTDVATQPLSSFAGSSVLLPATLDVIPKMIQESIHFFSLTSTFRNMLNKVKDNVLTTFYDDIYFSVSETDQQFHYTTAQTKLAADYPNYKNLVAQLQSGQDQGADVFTYTYTDTTGFATFADLNEMFLRLNSYYVGVNWADVWAQTPVSNPTKSLLPPAPTTPFQNITSIIGSILKPTPKDLLPPAPKTSPSFSNAFSNLKGTL